MSTKTHTSSINFKTLRGVFAEPKMNHRRDFLRENKLNLRELQKTTTHKITQQKQEQERKQHKHLQRYHKSQEHLPRRSASQCRNKEQKEVRESRKTVGINGGGTVVDGRQHHSSFRRAYSQQRECRENLQPSTSYDQHGGDNSSCCCSHQHNQHQQHNNHQNQHHHHHHSQATNFRENMPRSASNISVISKAESCDKEIQTEDINDEDFLYEALKKCSSSEVHQLNKQHNFEQLSTRDNGLSRSHASLHSQPHDQGGIKSILSHERAPYTYHDHYEDNKSQRDQYTVRSQSFNKLNGHNHDANTAHDGCVDEDLERNFQNLKMDSNVMHEQELPLSARSRQTLCSNSSKKTVRTNGSVYKMGCRDDLRLPRYLEKEKREKEEDRVREMSKDPNCPRGHYALTEQERLNFLHKLKHKMTSLIDELNHMPMTTETLRLRSRKVEIEKELTQLEVDIRKFSKPKVYLIEPNIQY